MYLVSFLDFDKVQRFEDQSHIIFAKQINSINKLILYLHKGVFNGNLSAYQLHIYAQESLLYPINCQENFL